MATRFTAPEEVFRSGVLFNATHGIDADPDAKYLELIMSKVDSRQAYERITQRFGFGLFQRRNIGQSSPIQEEKVVTKTVRSGRFALGYEIDINALRRDPNKIVAGKSPLLRASYIHSLNAQAQLAYLKCGASSAPLTSMIDGLAIYSTAHTQRNGNTSSNKKSYAVTGASFLQVVGDLNSQLNYEGLPVSNVEEWDVLCDPTKIGQVQTILESELFAGTSNNDTNSVIKRSFRAAKPMKYWQLGGSTTTNTCMFVPTKASERPVFLMMTEELCMEDEKAASVGKHGFYAWYESVFESLTHYNTLMINT